MSTPPVRPTLPLSADAAARLATRFDQQGYVVCAAPVVPGELVQAASDGMDAIREGRYDTGRPPCPSPWKPGDSDHVLCKIENPQFASLAIRELLQHPALGATIAAATGAKMVQVWWVQLLYKPPTPSGASSHAAGTGVGWHLDWTYWRSHWAEDSELLTAWLALSDVEEDCGPMCFVDGSHRWPNLEGGDFFKQELSRDGFTVPAGEQWHETAGLMQPGGLSLHHRLTLHGSGPNHSNRPRRSLAIHVRTEKSRPRDRVDDAIVADTLASFIDDLEVCPIIYGERHPEAFRRS